jgi:hypothetical protein
MIYIYTYYIVYISVGYLDICLEVWYGWVLSFLWDCIPRMGWFSRVTGKPLKNRCNRVRIVPCQVMCCKSEAYLNFGKRSRMLSLSIGQALIIFLENDPWIGETSRVLSIAGLTLDQCFQLSCTKQTTHVFSLVVIQVSHYMHVFRWGIIHGVGNSSSNRQDTAPLIKF